MNMIDANDIIKETEYMEYLIDKFYSIGVDPLGGVTRLGYTEVEDEMHTCFIKLAKELGLDYEIDQVGNTFVGDMKDKDYVLIGSHLDSVKEGGRFDGVSGVIAGLQIIRWMKDEGLKLPVRVGAFRCEESSNFGKSTLGSGFITGAFTPESVKDLVSKDGDTLGEIFCKRGYSLTPNIIKGVKEYLELHIEQSNVLEFYEDDIGIVTTIAAPTRFILDIYGQANHSGGTPMNIRKDALVAASEIILSVEEVGRKEQYKNTVATVGVIYNQPNVMNAIPGHTLLNMEIRGIDSESIHLSVKRFQENVEKICRKRKVDYKVKMISQDEPVPLSDDLENSLYEASLRLGYKTRKMHSGAGHDAINFPNICNSAMVFIPCEKGMSHCKNERTETIQIIQGAKVIYEYLKTYKRDMINLNYRIKKYDA